MADPINIKDMTPEQIAALTAAAGGQQGSGAIAASPNQPYIAMKKDQWKGPVPPDGIDAGDIVYIKNPNYGMKPATPTTQTAVGSADTGWFTKNTAGGYDMIVPPKTPNADEEISKALKRYGDESERQEKLANEQAGRGYQTTADYQKMADAAAKTGISQATLQENIRQFNETQGQKSKEFDVQQAAKDKVDAANILKTGAEVTQLGAQTGYTQAQTAQVQSAVDIAKGKAPAEIEELKARTAQALSAAGASDAQVKKALNDIELARAPQTAASTAATTSPNVMQTDPVTGKVSFVPNENYQPKTAAEIAARVGQIDKLARDKQAEINAKVGPNYTPDQAYQDFNAWWGQNVEPQQASLQAAQQDAELERAKTQAAMRTSAYTAANAAGTQYTNAFNAENAARVGPRFDEVMNQIRQSGGDLSKVDTRDAFTYTAPRPTMAGPEAVNNALKYIDPTAAAQAGAPPPNPAALAAQAGPLLNRTNYQFGATTPPPPSPNPATGADPFLMTPQQLAQLQNTTGQPGGAQVGGPPAAPQPAPPSLLPPGQAGVPGIDPRLSGQYNPQQAGPPMPDWLTGGAPPPPPVQALPAGMPAGPRIPSWGSYGYIPPDYAYQ